MDTAVQSVGLLFIMRLPQSITYSTLGCVNVFLFLIVNKFTHRITMTDYSPPDLNGQKPSTPNYYSSLLTLPSPCVFLHSFLCLFYFLNIYTMANRILAVAHEGPISVLLFAVRITRMSPALIVCRNARASRKLDAPFSNPLELPANIALLYLPEACL